MTRTRHSPWVDRIFHPYILRQYRKHLHGFYFHEEMQAINPVLPVLITPNYSTWWDGFFLYILNKRLLKCKLHLMMFEE